MTDLNTLILKFLCLLCAGNCEWNCKKYGVGLAIDSKYDKIYTVLHSTIVEKGI